ncbi:MULTISPECIES: D-alanyl-D-alanine carboxypeptidase family protein [Bacillus cereus group]|uniref:Peptidase S11 D-alanyl-D-alanine carboxypeptidase A N-terminal domain-containing protein n=1 Tax=Bacillus thuringiensis TaxID=1428 RepID=A0A1C4GET9_BACTU|nr:MULTISPECIES: serine hydrolase [Bacillus cereus group]MCC2329133.1 D-alanyl-D-alanine carboxypeptidase [Bacillus wiedmannii]MCU5498591.1 D-alanyl-D-alanine carboxypeptidase [Bacillus wiedmannii]MCU5681932.1 D-alanyl-D-alanine carboxypeptidase [Bacillus wiedmannii]MDP1455527.1 D-alanyl-D-alanine carboxypeptidase [Bacillus wiedmannii]MED2015193.1 D-alanyl-D-alanine carboxypeptidase [Bacillus wiedmannii]
MKRTIVMIVMIATLFTGMIFFSYAQRQQAVRADQPNITGQYGITIDADTGEILYGKREDERSYPASIGKMMTTLLLLENVKENEEITVTENAIKTESQSKKIKLRAGEKLKRDEALKLMLIISADPIAESIAEHIAGSKNEFVKMMNARAKELGTKHATFKNASGADALGNKVSPYDIAIITKEALKYPVVLEYMNSTRTTLHTSERSPNIANYGREELYDDPYAIGSKSGLSALGKYTVVTVDEKDGKRVINVVLSSTRTQLYPDTKKMAHYAFQQLK